MKKEKATTKKPLCVISLETFGEYAKHDIQTNSLWRSNPYENYAVVPDDMVDGIMAAKGYCDIETKDEDVIGTEWVKNEETGKHEKVEKVIGTRKVVTKWIAGTIPEAKEDEAAPTEMEQLRADIDFLAIMTGVEL